MKSSFPYNSVLRGARATTLLLASGGSLIFLPFAAQAQAQSRTTNPPVTKAEKQLTAADLGMTDTCFAQLQALMAEKDNRNPAQQKLDSDLIFLAKMANGKPIAPGVDTLEISVKTDIGGRVLVDLNASVSKDLLNTIVYSGGELVDVHPEYNSIRAWVVIDDVETLAQRNDVVTISRAATYKTNAGSVDGQGDTAHDVNNATTGARAIYGTDGTGILVGILSDSDTKRAASAATGDLPPVSGAEPTAQDLAGQTGSASSAEGTAMMEIIHDIAPGAGIRFATADGSEAGFAANIISLQNAGCSVIADDVFYLDEPPFMDGTIAKSVDTVTANGALYFSSAGNQGSSNYYNSTGGPINLSSVWEGDFVDGGALSIGTTTPSGTVQSYGGTLYNTTAANGGVTAAYLYWSDPQGASTNDYDMYASASGTSISSTSNATQNGTQNPFEAVSISSTATRRIYIFKKSTGAVRMLHLNTFNGDVVNSMTFTTTGQTHGHSQARNAFAVAAAPANVNTDGNAVAGPYPNAFTASSPYEYFSSEGPRRVHYLNNGTAITPGNFTSTGGELRLKPDLTAADGVNSSAAFSASSGLNPFYGTSAAAPHAAAIAALVRSYKSANATAAANVPAGVTINGSLFTTAEMRTILINGCIDMTSYGATAGWDRATGYGILMPKKALAFVTAFADPNQIGVSADGTTATITWKTALSADSIVEYGSRAGVYTNTVTGTAGTSHVVTLTGLTPATPYSFRVRSKTGATDAASGAIYVGPDRSFATSGTANPGNASIIGTVATSTANPNPTVTLTIKNAGTGAATNLRITSVSLAGVNTSTSMPTAPITLAAGGTTTSTLNFTGITSGTKVMAVKGSYDGAYFNFTIKVVVP